MSSRFQNISVYLIVLQRRFAQTDLIAVFLETDRFFIVEMLSDAFSDFLFLLACSDVTGKGYIFRIIFNVLLFEEHDSDSFASKLVEILKVLSLHDCVLTG